MLIGQLAKQSGFSRDTIRYYERLGLIAPQRRTAVSSYKIYGPECHRRLEDVARLKKAGFTLREIRELAKGAGSCRGLPQRMKAKLVSLDRKLEELLGYKATLGRMEIACNEECSTTRGFPDCVVPSSQGCCT
jgi:MerR family transcriptional regulator, copper efflux regulator